MSEILERHRRIWNEKKILREAYGEWYKKIAKDLLNDNGKTIEIGGGSGNFKEIKPDIISSDIDKCRWLDLCFDAHYMPFADGTVSNIVLVDVLHHLSNPVHFFNEAARVLKNGGRVVMVEPFPSPFSLFIYKIFHPEPFVMDADYFDKRGVDKKDPWESNQAIPYLLFFKHKKKFMKTFWQNFNILKRNRISCILYPLSGGFENRALIPDYLIEVFKLFEMLLTPFRWFMAFRCYVVIEKKG